MSKGINSLADSLADEWTKEVMPRRLARNQLLVLFKVFHEITGDSLQDSCASRIFAVPPQSMSSGKSLIDSPACSSKVCSRFI